jgi:hypothetical protein
VPARARLVARAKHGGITLVVGAGISRSRHIPMWDDLAQLVWGEAFGDRPSPWTISDPGHSPREVPQFLPIIFELAYRKLGETAFLEVLRKHLYANARYPREDGTFKRSNESLAVISRLIVQEHKRDRRRRINAIITFNVDDLLEQGVSVVAGLRRWSFDSEIVRVYARGTHSDPVRALNRPVPLYHVHGFVPSNHVEQYGQYFDHMLVFTDAQYWSSSSTGQAFANRVISSALSEGCCIFLGLSMTDINILRWLALRTIERDRDVSAVQGRRFALRQEETINSGFDRHFWIRPQSNDPTGFMSEFLRLRGVDTVDIEGWDGRSFQGLIEQCFPAKG